MNKLFKEYIVFLYLIIIGFIGLKGIQQEINHIVLIPFLLLLILSVFMERITYKTLRGIPIIIGGIISMVLGLKFLKEGYIFTLIVLIQYCVFYLKNSKLALIIIFSSIPMIINEGIIIEYLTLGTISLLFLSLFCYFEERISYLDKKMDEYRNEVINLRSSLRRAEEYRKQSLATFKLQERNKLSEKMHDKIGHTIASALLQLEAVKVVIGDRGSKAIPLLDNTTSVLRSGMDDIRFTLREIRPTTEQLGINKVKLLLEEKTNNTSFSYSLIYKGDIELITAEQWSIIVDGVMELSTNSIKYSRGNKISVSIEILKVFVKLQVKDNGIGFHKINKGMGLSGLEEKVVEKKGKFILDGGNGFSAIILLPVKGE